MAGSNQCCCNRITHIKEWEKKSWRIMCLPVSEQRFWLIGTNQDVTELYETVDLVADIERRSLSYVIRMDHTRMGKKTIESKP
jgi:hypothetical protein